MRRTRVRVTFVTDPDSYEEFVIEGYDATEVQRMLQEDSVLRWHDHEENRQVFVSCRHVQLIEARSDP